MVLLKYNTNYMNAIKGTDGVHNSQFSSIH